MKFSYVKYSTSVLSVLSVLLALSLCCCEDKKSTSEDETPAEFELVDIAAIDLVRLGVVAASLVATVVQPVRRCRCGKRATPQHQQADQRRQGAWYRWPHSAYSDSGVMRSNVGTPPSDCQVGKCELVV